MVLAEFSGVMGIRNTAVVFRRILEKLYDTEPSKARLCFSQNRYIFLILQPDGLTFLPLLANDIFTTAGPDCVVPGEATHIKLLGLKDLTETASSSYAAMTDATSMAYLPQTVVLCEH
ncbi:Vesicle-associated membrane protein 714 [Striga hermonthica]|uniref:Vesicle-associated membrane protein 714 n=1 Tax=Striga hermonthica TaxID=68872 RepID=A0A9N7MKX1_STRHE|nr:Vesicle-associated membrane protein 714 [Striga hermonthica]